MNSSVAFHNLLWQLLYMVPMAILIAAGIVLAVMNWARHPKPALLVLISSVLALLHMLASFAFGYGVALRYSAIHPQLYSALYRIGMAVLYVTSYTLLLAAVFAGRSTQTAPKRIGDFKQSFPPDVARQDKSQDSM